MRKELIRNVGEVDGVLLEKLAKWLVADNLSLVLQTKGCQSWSRSACQHLRLWCKWWSEARRAVQL